MRNLAGQMDADSDIELELEAAGIPVVTAPAHQSEVPYTLIGQLGDFTFTRAWYYWVVSGRVPVEVARQLYDDEVGRRDVRVCGHCGCPPPEAPWVQWFMPDGRMVGSTDQEAKVRELALRYPSMDSPDDIVWSDDPESIGASCFVTSYNIDSERGLRLFTRTLREHKLVPDVVPV